MIQSSLVDLKDRLSDQYSGIFCPTDFNLDFEERGVSPQFRELAETYHQKYTDYERYKGFITRGLAHMGVHPPGEIQTVLDVGSGSGNTFFPLLEMFPQATLIATDISPQLLRILQEIMTPAQRSRTTLLCLDLTETQFQEGICDLAVGGAILHHMFDPAIVIRENFRALKKNGWLMYTEPFEVGNSLLKLAYSMILNLAGHRDTIGRWSNPLPAPAIADKPQLHPLFKFFQQTQKSEKKYEIPHATYVFLCNYVADLEFRRGRDKSHPNYKTMDDKWLFTRKYIEDVASDIGASELQIHALDPVTDQFTNMTKIYFRLALSGVENPLPDWGWEILKFFDDFFSADLQNDLYPEAMILLKK